jgi:hypothetical protein
MFGLVMKAAKVTQYRGYSIFWRHSYFGIFLANLAGEK